MRLHVASLLVVIASIAGCAAERGRLAHLDAGRACVEPPELPPQVGDVARIAHAGGYLACRDGQANAAEDDDAVHDGLRRLVVVAAAEGVIDPGRFVAMLQDEPTLAMSCDAAARETLRPRGWPESASVVAACGRVKSRVVDSATFPNQPPWSWRPG